MATIALQLGRAVAHLDVDQALAEPCRRAFRDLAASSPMPPREHPEVDLRFRIVVEDERCTLYEDEDELGWRDVLASTLSTLQSRLNIAHIETTGAPVVLHASSVVIGGRTVVFAAPSGCGKTTAAAALARAATAYLGDEAIAVVGEGSRIGGFPKPLTLKPGTLATFDELTPVLDIDPTDAPAPIRLVAATALHPSIAPRWSADADLVAIVDRRPDAGAPEVEVLTPAAAIQLLCPATFGFEPDPLAAIVALTELVGAVPVVRLSYRDARDLAAAAPGLFVVDRPDPRPGTARPVVAGRRRSTDHPGRVDGAVAVDFDGETLFFEPEQRAFIRTHRVAGAVWRHADGDRDRAGVASRAAGEGWSMELAGRSIDDLTAAGLLR